MNAELIPDIAALATLIALLDVFRRRNPEQRIRQWLVGMIFIFVECVARMFYKRTGPLHIPMHIVALDAYVLAGAVFISSARREMSSLTARIISYGLNILPILAIETMYGSDYYDRLPYYLCCAFAIVTGLVMALVFPHKLSTTVKTYVAFRIVNWIPVLLFIHFNQMRAAAYWLLAVLFLAAGIGMQQTLPRRSAGKLAIVAGFSMWAFCFAIHPAVDHNGFWAPIASRFWDLQKFTILVGMLMVLLDEQIQSNRSLALHDELTGLPNRRLLEDRLSQAISRSERTESRTAVLMIDLNGFKGVNDTLGHAAGDILLRMVGNRLRASVRSSDTLARYGGDEFVVIVSDLPSADALHAIRVSMARAVSGYYDLHAHAVPVEASIGASLYPDDAITPDELLHLADRRMYEHKQLRGPIEVRDMVDR